MKSRRSNGAVRRRLTPSVVIALALSSTAYAQSAATVDVAEWTNPFVLNSADLPIVGTQDDEQTVIRAGEPAPFSGILVTETFFDDLIAGGEVGEAGEAALRGWRSALALLESRAKRIEELEGRLGAQKWILRGAALTIGVCGFGYGHATGRLQELSR